MPAADTVAPVLVTGGAGYIGSHVVLALIDAGYDVVVVDDLSTGERRLVPDRVPLEICDVGDKHRVSEVLRQHGCTRVLHFAGSIIVSESVENPLKYYANNTMASRNLLESCLECGVTELVFSSTAAVYGSPENVPVQETAPLDPISPYGASKLMTERILRDVAATSALRVAVLRYFNVAGADPGGRAGQVGPSSTHLIRVAAELVLGRRDKMEVFGTDYDTPDGTCIRDFIHVCDLADAHILALEWLCRERENLTLNCGYGHGYSVRQVLDTVTRVTDASLNIQNAARRPGDVPEVISDSTLIRKLLNWTPRHDDLEHIVRTSIDWERARPH